MAYKVDYCLKYIKCPVVARFGDEERRFEDGEHLCNTAFDKPYTVESIGLADGTAIEICLVERKINETSWAKGEDVSFFNYTAGIRTKHLC